MVWKMFDRISPRYDLLNRLLSLRRDVYWRRKVVDFLDDRPNQRVLDLATGTADVLLALMRHSARVGYGLGIDMADRMLELGRQKVVAAGLDGRIELKRGDATALDLASASFDAVTIAFGIRNLSDIAKGLAEMRRVLRPGGRALILEFSLPNNRLIRIPYLVYFRHVLPRVGALLSGDQRAYRYLERTVKSFPYGDEMCALIRQAGFVKVSATPLTFGTVTIYRGMK